MNISLSISLLLFIYIINYCFSASDDQKNDKEYAQAERRVKSLACSILSNTNIPFVKNTRRQIKDLLKKNEIIQKTADMKEKMPEFLAAICYSKIETDDAQEIVEKLSKRKMDVLQNQEYEELFEIKPDLNFTKIKRIMKRVKKIMKKIEKEEIKQENENENNDTQSFDLDEDNPDLNSTTKFSINNIINKIKKFFNNTEKKKLYIIGINVLIIVITIVVIFCTDNKSNNKDENGNEKKDEEKKKKNENNEEKKEGNNDEENKKGEQKTSDKKIKRKKE